jgi:hypothetical protein
MGKDAQRDKFAAWAMHAILLGSVERTRQSDGTKEISVSSPDSTARAAYRTADAMMEARRLSRQQLYAVPLGTCETESKP